MNQNAPGRLLAIVALSAFTAGSARAEEPSGALASPSLKLTVTPAATRPWTLRIQNTGESPVRIAADPRLLSLDITTTDIEIDPKKKIPLAPPKCVLPDDARPSTDEGHELVIPANRAWSAQFDPLFYCFGPRERAALVAKATVKARFGWHPPPTKAKAKANTAPAPAPPFAATPIGASVGKIAPLKELEADPITLPDGVALTPPKPSAPTTRSPPAADAPAPPTVSLALPETMDAGRPFELSTTVSLVNEGDRAITTLFRPDLVQFTVNGPNGSVGCGTPRSIGSPIKELFITVPSKGKTSLAVLFTETCPDGTFDQPGLYRVGARLDTTNASGRTLGVKSWDDVAITKAPMLLRVRQSQKPATRGPRPTLD